MIWIIVIVKGNGKFVSIFFLMMLFVELIVYYNEYSRIIWNVLVWNFIVMFFLVYVVYVGLFKWYVICYVIVFLVGNGIVFFLGVLGRLEVMRN